jgi:predicted DCC family thiol-disulfide oxidoreductase YuxK
MTTADAAVLIFDGDCGFCSACVRWGFRNLDTMPEAVPLQLAALDQLGVTRPEAEGAVWLVETSGRHRGHLAVAALLRMQRSRFWRVIGWVMRQPILHPVFDLGYRTVVRYRHRLPGATENCALPAKGGRD